MRKKNKVSIAPGLFTLPSAPSEQSRLIASRCKSCGEIWFPKAFSCGHCSGEDMEEMLLSTKGKVHSSTVVWAPPPLYEGPMPYAIGQVELPEGVIIPAAFTECDLEKPLPIGTDVEQIIEKFGEDEEGNEVMTYKFRPLRKNTK